MASVLTAHWQIFLLCQLLWPFKMELDLVIKEGVEMKILGREFFYIKYQEKTGTV